MTFPARVVSLMLAAVVTVNTALPAETVTRLETIGDWTLYADGNTPHLFCFVTSEPQASDPKTASRDAPRAYISAWPKDGVKGEVSFRMGFPVKKDSEGSAAVAAATYKLFGASDRAFVKDATQELKLIETLKSATQLTVAATSERGTAVTDTYSLTGLAAALQKLQTACF
jgi:Invasion associated locus B (IalB) protein